MRRVSAETVYFRRDEGWPTVGVWPDGSGQFSCFKAEPDDDVDLEAYQPAALLAGPFPGYFKAEREAQRLAGQMSTPSDTSGPGEARHE